MDEERFIPGGEAHPGKGCARRRRLLTERHLQFLWYNRLFFPQRLLTEEGRGVEVLHPGRPNLEGGPDFRDARLRFDGAGPEVVGDVEVHLSTAGWEDHGHHADPGYSGVVLHVAMWRSGESACRHNLRAMSIPQVILEPYLTESVADLISMMPPSGGLKRVPPGEHGAVVDLGRSILERKVERFRRLAAALGEGETLYRGFMSAMGYKNNKSQFDHLARRLPYRSLRETGGVDAGPIEALFRRASEGIPWRRAGMRPANRPEARMRAMARLLAGAFRRGGLEDFVTEDLPGAVRRIVEAGGIGRERAWMIAVNILLPFRLASGGDGLSTDQACDTPIPGFGGRLRPVSVAEHLGRSHFFQFFCAG